MSEKKGFIGEFKEFISRGNVMDLAVGVIIGGAFQSIVSSLCDDVIMPAIQLLISKLAGVADIEQMTKILNVGPILFGQFIAAIINFLIMAVIIFCIVKAFNKMMEFGKKPAEEPEPEPETKECPFCMSEISIKAKRCPHCTSQLEEEKKITVEKTNKNDKKKK